MERKEIQNPEQWNRFVRGQPEAQFLQSWEWGEFQHALHRPVVRFGVERDGKLVAAMQVLVRSHGFGIRSVSVYRGPIISPAVPLTEYTELHSRLMADLVALARRERATLVHVEPPVHVASPAAQFYAEQQGLRSVPSDQPQMHWLLSLAPSVDALRSRLNPKTRYNINLAEKKGVMFNAQQRSDAVETFLTLTHATARRKHIHPHPDSYFRTLLETLASSGFAKLYIAELNGSVLVANIMIIFGDTASYVHGASSDAARNVMAPHLLQWQQIVDAKAHGLLWYDFGGIVPDTAVTNHPWYGISRFKRGFGGEERRFIGGRERPMRSLLYTLVQFRRRLRR